MSDNEVPEIKICTFKNCKDPICYKTDNLLIRDCVLENCSIYYQMGKGSKLDNYQFIKCKEKFINVFPGDAIIENCEFINVKQSIPPEEHFKGDVLGLKYFGMNYWGINLSRFKDDNGVTLRNCLFDGINQFGFLRYENDKRPFSSKISTHIEVENCIFKHCVSGIIDKKNYHHSNTVEAITIKGCRGVEGDGGGQCENSVSRTETANGDPIGTNIEESNVGVPIYQKA